MNLKDAMEKKYVKGLFAILGALILGALGSGLWDVIFKPLFGSSRDLLLNIVSLGMQSLKTRTYAQIAQGFHEEASMNLLLIAVMVFVSFFIVLLVEHFEQLREHKRRHEAILQHLDSHIKEKEQPPKETGPKSRNTAPSLEEIRKLVKEDRVTRDKRIAYIFSVIGIMIISALIADYIRFSYVNSAITHFRQVYTIAAPFMDDAKRLEVLGSYAQIRNREDYVFIVEQLESTATQNGQRVPAFSAW